ncbi:apolipoprotein N-acyltransferase [Candidatus Zixiibacteriota bacterium]
MTGRSRSFHFKYFLASAVLLTLAQPPFPTGWLGYIALVPLLIALDGLSGRRAFLWGIVWSLMVNSLGLYWIAWGNTGAFFGALLYLGVVDALFVWFLATIRSNARPLMLPFLWTGFMFIKSLGEMGFPWLTLALTQTYNPAAIQLAALAGSWSIDLWVASVNSLMYKGMAQLAHVSHDKKLRVALKAFTPAIILALTVLFYGRITLWAGGAGERGQWSEYQSGPHRGPVPAWVEEGTEPLDVALIQGSVRPEVKLAEQMLMYNFYVYERLSRAAVSRAGDGLELVVWPETAIPQYLSISQRARRFATGLQEDLDLPILTGAFFSIYDEQPFRYYNSAMMVTGDGISQGEEVYSKRLLVPFGERVPYQQLFSFMRDWSMGWSDFSMGEGAPLLGGNENTPGVPPIGMLICYESAFARLVRPEVVNGAEVLSVITNDAWFGRTSMPYQHLRMASLRAVEFRRPVIRTANSGISAVIDRWGRIHYDTSLYRKNAVVARVWPEREMTPYARTGDWVPLLALIFGLSGLFILREPKQRKVVS